MDVTQPSYSTTLYLKRKV